MKRLAFAFAILVALVGCRDYSEDARRAPTPMITNNIHPIPAPTSTWNNVHPVPPPRPVPGLRQN